jgi:hypothetical protein
MSVFHKLRKLSDSNKEDFLTELFAHILKCDPIFREAFFSKLPQEYRNQEIQSVETQKNYPVLPLHYPERRPDIEIHLSNAVIMIENKVESGEGLGQLPDYAKILSFKSEPNKMLIYITVYRDEKSYALPEGVKFTQFRWQEIGEMITSTPKCGDFANEMKVYLKKEKLMMKKFDYQDLAAINVFFSTAEKINHLFLDDIGPYFVNVKKMSTINTFQPKINGKEYSFNYNYGRLCIVSFGIESWLEDEHPRLFIRIAFLRQTDDQKRLSHSVHETLGGDLKDWKWMPAGPNYAVVKRERILDFLVKEEQNQRPEMVKFFTGCIDEMVVLKNDFPEIFGNPTPEITAL